MSIAPNDAMLNHTLVAFAVRLHRVRKELLSTPSGIRQPEFGSSARRRRQDRSLSPFRALDTSSRRSRNEPPLARSTRSVRFWISWSSIAWWTTHESPVSIGVDSYKEGVYIMGTTSARSWITSKRIMSSDLAAAVVEKAGSGRLVPYLAQLLLMPPCVLRSEGSSKNIWSVITAPLPSWQAPDLLKATTPGCANNQYQGYLNARSRNSHICTMVASSNGMMAACWIGSNTDIPRQTYDWTVVILYKVQARANRQTMISHRKQILLYIRSRLYKTKHLVKSP